MGLPTGIDWGLKLNQRLERISRAGEGKVFVVDPAGGGDFLALQGAIDACVDWRGDVIIRRAGTEIVTTSVLFNKYGITVVAEDMGLPHKTQGERFMTYCSADDEPAAVISKACKLIGLGCSGEFVGAGGHVASIEGTGSWNGGLVELDGCRFTHWGGGSGFTGQHAHFLQFDGPGNASYIHDCSFDGLLNDDPLTVGAILLLDNAGGADAFTLTVEENDFFNCTNAIVHESGVAPKNSVYKGNRLVGTKMLDNNGCTCVDVLVADNWSPYATNATTYDDTVATLQGLGLQFSGNHYSE